MFVKNKRVKKKNLPSLLDDSRVSPRPQFQFVSSDFAKKKRGELLGGGGYESDVTGKGFNSTYEDGFPGVSTQDEADAFSSQWRPAGDSNLYESNKYNRRKMRVKRPAKALSVNSG